jgi:hypothetical protein
MRDLLFFSPAGKEGRVARGEPLHSARARWREAPVSIQKLCMQETLLLRSRARGTDSFVTFEAASETCLFEMQKVHGDSKICDCTAIWQNIACWIF